MTEPGLPDVPCQEFVELVTEYLDGALTNDIVARIDAHLGECPGCRRVLAQWGEVIRVTGRLTETEVDHLDPDTRSELMTAFRRRQSS